MTSKVKPNLYDSMAAFNGEKKAKDLFIDIKCATCSNMMKKVACMMKHEFYANKKYCKRCEFKRELFRAKPLFGDTE